MKTRFQVLLGLFALVLLVGGGCAAKAPADDVKEEKMEDKKVMEETGPVKIGWLGPLTGDASPIGEGARIAAEIAAEEINANGGINGRMIELSFEDSKCNPKDAVSAANKMIVVDGVRLINGAACSAETTAIAPIAEQNKAVLMSYCSSAPPITNAGDYIFRTYPSDAYQGVAAADYAYDVIGARKVAVLAVLDDWGQGIKNAFIDRIKERGGEIVYVADHKKDSVDHRTDLTKIASSEAELVYFPSWPTATIAGLKQMQELGVDLPVFGGDTMDVSTVHESGVADDVRYLAPKTNIPDDLKNKVEARGGESTICAPRAYDNMYLYADIIGRVGSDPEAVKNELYNVKDFPGAAGSITLDENGDLLGAEYNVKIIKNQKAEVLR